MLKIASPEEIRYTLAMAKSGQTKKNRQNTLLKIISTQDLSSQEELVEQMSHKGFHCTQTTISRDLLELHVMKVGGFYRTSETSQSNPLHRALLLHTVQVDTVGENLVIVKTISGLANAMAVEIDSSGHPGIAATLAGDDTIFVAVRSAKDQKDISENYKKILSKKNK